MKRAIRLATWIATQAGLSAGLYFGIIEGNTYAWNLVRFFIVVFAVLYSIGAAVDEVKRKAPEMVSVSPYVSGTFDVLVTGFLAATGHFVFAGLYAWTAMMSHGLHYPAKVTA